MIRMKSRSLRRVIVIGLLALAPAAAAPAASATPVKTNHCITPNGFDLNAVFGVSEQIVALDTPSCTRVGSGEYWRPSPIPWFMNHSFAVVPAGFVPAGATPLEDFVGKFTGVRYVVDRGTRRERTYVFTNVRDLWTGTSLGFPLVNPLTLGALNPLPVGHHEVETYWDFRAMHCDGFGDDTRPGGNCFRAGETQLPTLPFEVTPGRYRSSARTTLTDRTARLPGISPFRTPKP